MNEKIYYEAQLSCPEGRWGMTLTITRYNSTWTSPWFAFENMRFQTYLEARQKAAAQIMALKGCLEGDSISVTYPIPKPPASTASVYKFGDERDHAFGSRKYWAAMYDRLKREGRLPSMQEKILPLEGAWKCSNGHWFAYEPPPIYPPWCAIEGCDGDMFVYIVKDSVTEKDWPPYLPYPEHGLDNQPLIMRPMTEGPPWLWSEGKPASRRILPEPYKGRHRRKEGEGDGELLPEVRSEPEEP